MDSKQRIAMRVILGGFLFLFLTSIHQVKGRCSQFGHSCFGAHGKRGDSIMPPFTGSSDIGNSYGPGAGQPFRAANDFYPVQNSNRVSPLLIEWLAAVQQLREGKNLEGGKSKEEYIQTE